MKITQIWIYKKFKKFIEQNNDINVINIKINKLYKYMKRNYCLISYIKDIFDKDKIINLFKMLIYYIN